MIEIKELSIKVKENILLDKISLTLSKGRIYALLGDNGSGKTTLMRALSSYYLKYDGSILFCGNELKSLKRGEKKRLHAILPQSVPSLDMSVESLLAINDSGLDELEKLGLSDLRERRVSTLSGGEREMVYLAFLLSRDAEVYLFDEVEANLDMKFKKRAEEAMLSLKNNDKIVISSFHDINRAINVADEIILLSDGKLIFSGDKNTFLESNLPKEYFDLTLKELRDREGNEVKMLI